MRKLQLKYKLNMQLKVNWNKGKKEFKKDVKSW